MRALRELGVFLAGVLVGAAATATFLALAPTSRPLPPLTSSPTPIPTNVPTPPANGTPQPHPTIDSSLNFLGGDFETAASMNDCKMLVTVTATSKADGTGGAGNITLTAVQSTSCSGRASGRVTCLLVNGNHAVLSGWLDEASGIFSAGSVVQGTFTQADPQPYGPPVDRAGIGIASGSPECPPFISGSGPAIMTGTIQVSPARSIK